VAEPRYTLSNQDVRTLKGVVRKVSAGKVSQRPLPTRRRTRNNRGGSGLVKVLITGDVAAAGYSSGTLTPAAFTARLWMSDGDNWTQSADDTKECTNPYLTAITVTSGSGRVAWVTSSGELHDVDCTEFVL
jgi:hypothetical protein